MNENPNRIIPENRDSDSQEPAPEAAESDVQTAPEKSVNPSAPSQQNENSAEDTDEAKTAGGESEIISESEADTVNAPSEDSEAWQKTQTERQAEEHRQNAPFGQFPPYGNSFYANGQNSGNGFGNFGSAPYHAAPKPRRKIHNAFRDVPTVTEDVEQKFPNFLKGPAPLEGEQLYDHYTRVTAERHIIRTEAAKSIKKSITKLSLLLLLFIAIYTFISIAVGLIAGSAGEQLSPTVKTILMAVTYILIYPMTFPVIIYLGNMEEKTPLASFFRKPQCSPLYILKWILMSIGIAYAINYAYSIITSILRIDTGMSAEPFTSVFDMVSQLVTLCVFAPIFEELLFRGIMLSHHMKYGALHACLITALYFGFFHMNAQQLLYTSVTGLFFAIIVIKTGSLISSMIIHAVLNFISFLQVMSITLIDNYNEIETDPNWMPQGEPWEIVFYIFMSFLPLLIMLIGVIMFFVELKTNKRLFVIPKGDSELTSSEKLSAFLTSPAAIAVILVSSIFIIVSFFIM